MIEKTVDPEGLKLYTLAPDNMPVVEILAESALDDGTRPVEYQYKVDRVLAPVHRVAASSPCMIPGCACRAATSIHVRSRAAGDP